MSKNESLSVKEFWRRREQLSKELSKMSGEEVLAFFHREAKAWEEDMNTFREEKARAEATEQAKEA
ncbi:MAG: hypothetical protein LBQ96_01570 [Fusobacteriaceae bacterium]|jgi:hypothetical protein|nr:hypothetical protein [Fusobacteriaceae bacterium]